MGEIELGPNINFIHGLNGSGKSAVLVGLQTCLGARASVTNRGQSIKDLIKYGCDSAELSVSILNQGADAYQHHKYGDIITITREIRSHGKTTGYKILNVDDKIVSRKRNI